MKDKSTKALVLLSLASCAAAVHAADGEVQRQLQLRDQQQMELRLKMQQQLDRAIPGSQATQVPQPPVQAPRVDARRRTLERDQQQRLQMLHEQQLRSGITAPDSAQLQRDLERQRALGSSGAELERFNIERRVEPQ